MNIMKIITSLGPKEDQNKYDLISYEQAQIAQQSIIKALKQEILRLQQDLQRTKQQNRTLTQKLKFTEVENLTLKEKIQFISENNQSLLQTFQVFQRQFVKRNREEKSNSNNLWNNNQQCGPFHLQIVRTVKSQFVNNWVQPLHTEKSQFSLLYSYFFQQNSVQEEQVSLYNQLVQGKKTIRASKIKNLGKRSFFNERFRHIFWYNAIQNKIKLTEKYYNLIEDVLQQNLQNRPPKNSIIDLDIRRMDFKVEQEKTKKLRIQLRKLLQLFQIHRPDIGYVQGMSYIGWMFIIRMNPIDSFISFTNIILTDPFISSLYTFKEQNIKRIVSFFEQCLNEKRPKLFKHMKNLSVDSELFIIQWAYTFYTRTFSLKITSKIWDLWLSEGFNVFFKVAVSIFQMLEGQLMETIESDKFIELIRSNTFKLDQNQLIKNLTKQKLFQQLKLE